MARKKNLYVENDMFQNIEEYPLNIALILNILHTEIKYNIATCKLDVHKTCTK